MWFYRASPFRPKPGWLIPSSELVLLNLDKTTDLHNGGSLAFSPNDNYLYVGVGDDTVMENAQDLTVLKGKVLRLDVDNGIPYAIPPDNPFVDSPGMRSEIWASGLRNPWRMSIDPTTGDLFIGDVGWNYWEEIDLSACFQQWRARIMDGRVMKPRTRPASCPIFVTRSNHTRSLFTNTFTRSAVRSVGGYVYRGSQIQWHGDYFFGDLCSRTISALRQDTDGSWTIEQVGTAPPGYIMSTFGVDSRGEVYIGEHQNYGDALRNHVAVESHLHGGCWMINRISKLARSILWAMVLVAVAHCRIWLALSMTSSARADTDNTVHLPVMMIPRVFALEAYPNGSTQFNNVTDIANAGDERVFVVTREGVIWVVKSDDRTDTIPRYC